MLIIGSHVSMKGDSMYVGSVLEAVSYKANAFMIYTGAPQNTIRRSISSLRIDEALELMEKHGLKTENVVVHAPYIINLANPDPEKRAFAVSFLTEEIKRTDAMHVSQIVLHPGSAVGLDREAAVKWIAEGINQVFENTKGVNVKIALETMAGKGNEVGRSFEELRAIIDLIEDQERVSVCFDTCHTSDAGYDIKNDFEGVMKKFDEIVGKEKISVFHINDSKNPMGARKDRHENFGFGHIGFDSLVKVVYHSDFTHVPKILESPYVDDKAPYGLEIAMIRNKKFDEKLFDSL
ncbi:MAG: deoxyribonuclease IV [Acholeplasmataceae bacterium]